MNQLFREWINRYFSNPQVLILWFLLILGFTLILFLGQMLAPVLAAIIIAYLLEGLVNLLEKRRVPRKGAVLVVFLIFMVSFLILLVILLPLVSRQVGQLLQQLPAMFAKGQNLLIQLPEKYPGYITADQIRQITASMSNQITGFAQQILSFSLASVRGLISVIIYLILVPLMIFFFLKDKQIIIDWVKNFLPDNRGLALEVWREVNQQFANYVRGKIMEIIIVGGDLLYRLHIHGIRLCHAPGSVDRPLRAGTLYRGDRDLFPGGPDRLFSMGPRSRNPLGHAGLWDHPDF